jgi:hypothetical protein
MTRKQFNKLSSTEIAKIIQERDKTNAIRLNKEIDKCKMAYKVQDTDGNIFVFGGIENGFPWFRTRGGSKHIFNLCGYSILEKHLEV